ncbi:MAG: dynamin family protein [Desulfobacterales bacterium]|jgi:GTPase SAR1 family protein
MEPAFHNALLELKDGIPRLAQLLQCGQQAEMASWRHIVEAKLIPRFSTDYPIVAAICGGGSSGKSTLFNSLAGEALAPTGGRAGMNRRVLFSVPESLVTRNRLVSDLAEPFKADLQPLNESAELTRPGNPLYVINRTGPQDLVLLDTPDFDTGARGEYTNRDVTRMALEASDIFIYIFTNSNYNNRDNTDFMSEMLTGIGTRKCFLIYRVYPNFSDEEVREHAMTVAGGIYGTDGAENILGIYRTDEDNRVAAGDQFMRLRPITENATEFDAALAAIDAPRLRLELHSSILADVFKKAETFLADARCSLDELQLYLDAFQTVQSQYVHEALKHFPMDRVMKRFAKIWAKTDPAHIKFMRKTGNVIEFPLKMLFGAAGWAKARIAQGSEGKEETADFNKKLEEDLVTAVSSLHAQAIGPQISVNGSLNDPVVERMAECVESIRMARRITDTQNPRAESADQDRILRFFVDTHPAVLPQQARLRDRDFKSMLQTILSEKEELLDIPADMLKDLKDLANEFRSQMGLWSKISQTFWASLNVLPATAAVTYVLSTGDPVGAAGIKVKLTGLFGAKDLYALVAIPVTTQMKKADQQQLKTMLGPIAQAWFDHKLKKVQQLFEDTITGDTIGKVGETIEQASADLAALQSSMDVCTKELE